MNLPKKLNILGDDYSITYSKDALEAAFDERTPSFGSIDMWEHTIKIMKGNRTEVSQFQTLMHETIHAIGERMGIELDERDTDLFATVLTDTLIRNKLLRE